MKFKDFIYSKKIGKTHTVTRILGIKFKIRNGRWETKIKRREKNYDVGIISFNIHSVTYNFGAALHSYAFQKYLDKKGIDNVIVNYYPETTKQNFIYQKILNNLKEKDYQNLCLNLRYGWNVLIKKIKFERFFKKNCKVTQHRYELDTLPQLKTINRFVCETDITWAKFKIGGYDRGFMCDLPNMKSKDNVAYSIDFGYGKLENNKTKLKKYSKNFKYISVRNVFKIETFKNVIEKNDVVLTIDPVFLLGAKDYSVVAKKPNVSDEYVLVYNCADNNTEMLEKAKQFAKEKNLKVIIINSYSRNILEFKDSLPTIMGIEDFLGHIQNCRYFFTNSYHGICFAIIFGIQFYVFSRIFESEKLFVLLELFGLQNRYVENDVLPDSDIDYTLLEKRLEQLKRESEDFIQNSIIENSLSCIKGNF